MPLFGDSLPKALTNALTELVKTAKIYIEAKTLDLQRGHAERVTKNDLANTENRIMSAISEFAAKQKAFNDRQGTAIDGLVTSVAGLTEDVAALNKKIEDLQNSPGEVTPEDQALLNELETAGEGIATKLEAASTALKALDEQTPPVVPPTPA